MSKLPTLSTIASRLAPLAAGTLAALGLAGGRVDAQPPLWIAHGPRSTLVLFGSVHLLPAGLDWEPPALVAALAKADQLWFELPIDEATDMEAARLARARGALPAGERLSDLLTAAQAKRLSRVVEALRLAPDAVEHMRPWLAEVALSLAADRRAGALASEGVERQIEAFAPTRAAPRALESARQQIGFLAGPALADQVASLDETLHEMEDHPDSYRHLVTEWMAGDLTGLDAEALSPLRRASPSMYARLMTQRNQRWTRILARRLARPGYTVVIVGAGHLVGSGGVPSLLRARGVRVEGP